MSMKALVLISLLAVAISASEHTNRMRAAAREQTACQPQLDRTNRPPHGWTNIGPGSPGVVAPVAVDPNGSGTIYVGSIGGGVRKSTDDGATWATVGSGLNGTAVYSLALDASGPDTIYAGVFNAAESAPGGVFKSTNGGSTWALLDHPLTRGTVPTSLAADPSVPGVIFVGLLGGAINKSVDGGENWTRVFPGTTPVTSIVIDPLDSNTVYASTLGGLLKSANGGVNWSVVAGLTPRVLWGVAIDPANDNVVYVAAAAVGVWRSQDGGITWQSTGTLPVVAYALAVDPSPAHTVYVATSNGVWESANNGATWQTTSLTGTKVMSIIAPDAVVYAGTTSGPAVSRDFGATWNYPDPDEGGAQAFVYAIAVDPNDGCKLFASALGSDVFISHNEGVSWTRVGTDFTAPESRRIAVDPTNSNLVYAGSSYSGLFKSTDGGTTWSRRNFGSDIAYVWIPVVDPVSPNIVYAGTRGEGLFKSTNYGENWTLVPGLPRNVEGITVDPRNHNEVFAAAVAGGSGGVFRSHDQGQTWERTLARPAWSITIVGGDSPVVYATTKTDGVYRSIDGGTTWHPINNGITELHMGRSAPVIVTPEGSEVLYVASEGGGGVFRSGDGGDSWIPVNRGLTDTSVFGLAADPRRPGTLYVSGPHGVFATATGGR